MQSRLETRVGIFILVALGIFMYMGFQIGAFRFDKMRYAPYVIYFSDVSDLTKKAKVRIAGVNVGWVEDLDLISDGSMQVKVVVMVLKEYRLSSDAHAIVRQEGLLGPKYLEIVTGDPTLPAISPGGTLSKPSVEPVAIDDLLQKVKRIASNVAEVTDSLKDALGGDNGRGQLRQTFDSINTAAEKLASFSDILERSFARNETSLDSVLDIGNQVRRISDRLDEELLPSFKDNVDKIANRLSSATEVLEDASLQVRDSFRSVTSVADKIDQGKGLIGKLINEDETYRDIKVAAQGLKNYFAKVDMLELVFDTHFETMQRPAQNYYWEDAKGYFDVRIHPTQDHFYVLQLATSERGFITRREEWKSYYNDRNEQVDPNTLALPDWSKLLLVYRPKYEDITRCGYRFGLQFGKIFRNIALRLGLFEGSAGVGVDFDIPFDTDKFRWVTTLEAFDMTGFNREPLFQNYCGNYGTFSEYRYDRRPHLKWLNRMFILRNIYLAFGADDFISKFNANAFFGAGVRFGDDDFKYLLSSIGGAKGLG